MPGENLRPESWTTDVITSLGKDKEAFNNDPFMYGLAELTAQVMFDGHATAVNPQVACQLFKALSVGIREWDRDPLTLEKSELSLLVNGYLQTFTAKAETLDASQLEKHGREYYHFLANLI